MINLLPLNEKKNLAREYATRRLIVALSAAGVLLLIAFVFLSTLYWFVSNENDRLSKNVGVIEERIRTGEAGGVEQSIQHLNSLLSAVPTATSTVSVPPSLLLDRLEALRPATVTFASVSCDQNPDGSGVSQVVLGGNALNREVLLAFVQALSKDPLFVSVDSPISNLVRPERITFELKATIKLPKP